MSRYIIRRFGEMILTLFLIATATYFLLAAVPGNALTGKIEKLPKTTQEQMLKKYGYDLSIRAENLSLEVFVDICNSLIM